MYPDAESTRVEDTSQAEPDPSLPDAESTRIETVAASSRLENPDSLSTSHESLHPPIEISWGSQLEEFVREQFEGSTVETGDVSMPTDLDEQSIGEPVRGQDFTVNQEVAGITFHLVEQGTKRGKARLVDNLGYTYNFDHRRSYATYWQCTVRPKGNPCRASVTERDGTFQPGKNGHNHPAEVGTAVAAKIVTKVKAKAAQQKFRSAAAIVDEVLQTLLQLLPREPAVKQVTLDFEKAVWLAMRSVLPDVQLKGCAFHWTQAL